MVCLGVIPVSFPADSLSLAFSSSLNAPVELASMGYRRHTGDQAKNWEPTSGSMALNPSAVGFTVGLGFCAFVWYTSRVWGLKKRDNLVDVTLDPEV